MDVNWPHIMQTLAVQDITTRQDIFPIRPFATMRTSTAQSVCDKNTLSGKSNNDC